MDINMRREYAQLNFDYVRETTPDPKKYYMHIHSDLELYYFVEGHVEYHVENSVYHLNPGDILIMRTAEAHCAQVFSDMPYERFILMFSPELLKQTMNGNLLAPYFDRPIGTMNHYPAHVLPAQYIRTCIDRMFLHEENTSRMRPLVYLLGILQEIYDVWTVHRQDYQFETADTLVSRIISYINRNLMELKNLQQLEQHFFLCQSHLNRVFREFVGTSIWKYVQTKRLITARELLQSGSKPQNVAVSCGYQDYSSFYRAYQKQFGHNPREDMVQP